VNFDSPSGVGMSQLHRVEKTSAGRERGGKVRNELKNGKMGHI